MRGGVRFVVDISKCTVIPGFPVAYWLSKQMLNAFGLGTSLGLIAAPRQGFATGDNSRFLRLWHEVDQTNSYYTATDYIQALWTGKKWFPCNKGGSFRKWYGNNEYVVNWQNDGSEMKGFSGSVIRNSSYYFQEGGTWSTIASNDFSMRYSPKGFMFESKGSVCFVNDKLKLKYIIGFLNTKIVRSLLLVLSPTLDFHEGPLGKIPVIIDEQNSSVVNDIVNDNITTSKQDWDSFEESWDFIKHPLI